MIGALAALALLPSMHLPAMHLPSPKVSFENPFRAFKPGPNPQVSTEKTALDGDWRLVRTADPFTGLASCAVDGRRISFQGGVATFSFGAKVDTANALYRVDAGPIHNVGEVGPQIAGMGVSLFSRNTFNPSDGRVRLPWSQLAGAQRVDIRPNDHRYHQSFDLAGLNAALAQARAQGCSDLKA